MQSPGAARAWTTPAEASRRFSPRILDLGARGGGGEEPLRTYRPPSMHAPSFSQNRLADVTFIVKAFERPDCLRRLLKSIGSIYRDANLLVLDDSRVSQVRVCALGFA